MQELDSCRAELARLREAQAASREILARIARVQDDAQPVFERIALAALRVCNATQANLITFDGRLVHLVAQAHARPADPAEPDVRETVRSMFPRPPGPELAMTRAVQTGRRVVVPDVHSDPDFSPEVARVSAAFSVIGIPMLRGGVPIGALGVGRSTAGPFPDEQVALLETFVEQATIAIENARLFRETREALEHLTATSDVLRVISGSMADATPVFENILDTCGRLFGAADLAIFLVGEEGMLKLAACRGGFAQWAPRTYPRPLAGSMSEMAIAHGAPLHWADLQHGSGIPGYIREAVGGGDNLSVAVAPLLWEGRGIGTIDVMRRPARAYSGKELALLATFAEQAVIAIQNARVLNETREALEQQRISSEVLATISGSVSDAGPAFDKILESCRHLFGSDETAILLVDDQEQVTLGAYVGKLREEVAATFPAPLEKTPIAPAIRGRRVVHYRDIVNDAGVTRTVRNVARLAGYRSMAYAPMIWDERGIGAVGVSRTREGGFTGKELSILQTFADQAVIAIQNARLFTELAQRNREVSAALEQQTATSEILRVISRSPTDVQPVFEAIARAALALCRAVSANVLTFDGQLLHLGARASAVPDTGRVFQVFPRPASTDTVAGRAVRTRRVSVIPDVADDPDYTAPALQLAELTGARSFLGVPLLREGSPIGAIAVGRPEAGPIPEQQLAVLQTFADQAVIAIENVRLFNALRDKGAQLELASRHKSQFLANMSHELRTPLNAIIGFTRIVMRRAGGELDPRQYENLEKILASGQHLLALINALLDLSKIEAGHVEVRAREIALGPVLEQCLLTVEPLVRSDAVALAADIDPALPHVLADEEKLRQIVLNLLGNAVKFTERGSVRLRASAANGALTVAVADTGIGIPPDKLDLVFEEFEQADAGSTRQYGGTGLGLAIARRLARLMGGDIAAQSSLGNGSTFTLVLPLRYRPAAGAAP